jgi:hypothetical protein
MARGDRGGLGPRRRSPDVRRGASQHPGPRCAAARRGGRASVRRRGSSVPAPPGRMSRQAGGAVWGLRQVRGWLVVGWERRGGDWGQARCVCMHVCACVRACVCACVRACVRGVHARAQFGREIQPAAALCPPLRCNAACTSALTHIAPPTRTPVPTSTPSVMLQEDQAGCCVSAVAVHQGAPNNPSWWSPLPFKFLFHELVKSTFLKTAFVKSPGRALPSALTTACVPARTPRPPPAGSSTPCCSRSRSPAGRLICVRTWTQPLHTGTR